jgi:hypothetical protein
VRILLAVLAGGALFGALDRLAGNTAVIVVAGVLLGLVLVGEARQHAGWFGRG